jgi:hypothetical protein
MPYYESTLYFAPRFHHYKGVSVFHTYKDDEMEEGESPTRFVLREDEEGAGPTAFDVGQLTVPSVRRLTTERPAFLIPEPRMDGFTINLPDNPAEAAAGWAVVDRWHQVVQPAIVRAILEEAIDARLLVEPPLRLEAIAER